MGTKIRLSAEEKRLVRTEQFILTKNRILQKLMELMGDLKQEFDPLLSEVILPEGTASAKISRGENYKGLPWMMLDHPRYFSGKESLAIRSFFWWGHYFSISLQLSGLPKEKAVPRILEQFKELRKGNYFICVHKNPWQNDLGKPYYRCLKKMKEEEFHELITTKEFIKLSARMELRKWQGVVKPMRKRFAELAGLLT